MKNEKCDFSTEHRFEICANGFSAFLDLLVEMGFCRRMMEEDGGWTKM
jgi:hypothetical protein